MRNLEKEVCLKYKVKPKRISDSKLFKILEILIKQFYEIRLLDHETSVCSYDCSIEIGEDKDFNEETGPNNIGCGWGLRDSILTVLMSKKVLNDAFAYDEIRQELLSQMEKIKEFIYD